MDSLKCLNCSEPVPAEEAKVYAQVFVCPTCYDRAERLFKRSEKELKMLLTMLQEAIRVALIEGRLHFEAVKVEDVSKVDLMKALVGMEDARTKNRAKL